MFKMWQEVRKTLKRMHNVSFKAKSTLAAAEHFFSNTNCSVIKQRADKRSTVCVDSQVLSCKNFLVAKLKIPIKTVMCAAVWSVARPDHGSDGWPACVVPAPACTHCAWPESSWYSPFCAPLVLFIHPCSLYNHGATEQLPQKWTRRRLQRCI